MENRENKYEKKSFDNNNNFEKKKFVYQRRRKFCYMCKEGINDIDYKDTDTLNRFVSERQKIIPRKVTGTCAKHQRVIAKRVKMARNIALLSFKEQ
jgi:small subunit ribosomal protein S18